MSDHDRDPHPDSPPADARNEERPDDNGRPDIEKAVEAHADDVERGPAGDKPSVLDSTVSTDTAGGAGGTVRNQE